LPFLIAAQLLLAAALFGLFVPPPPLS